MTSRDVGQMATAFLLLLFLQEWCKRRLCSISCTGFLVLRHFAPMGSKVFRSATPLRVRNGQLVGARANLEQTLSQNGYGNFFIARLALQVIDQDIRKFLLRPSGKHIVVQPHGNAFACTLEASFCCSVVTSSGSYGSCKTRWEVPNGFRCKYRIFVLRSSFFLVVLVFSGWPRWSGMVFSCQFSQFPALQHGNFSCFSVLCDALERV